MIFPLYGNDVVVVVAVEDSSATSLSLFSLFLLWFPPPMRCQILDGMFLLLLLLLLLMSFAS